ncbi:MAG TPA: 40S ribosomal protein S19 [Candidatus Nanoarchaeia archaeon]|nr:40S ribosomal protein S19 [Candidatus Nanoarchaeia archaeon]
MAKANLTPQGVAKQMTNPVYELNSHVYNLKLAEALKQIPEIEQPEWAKFVKSGPSKERPIDDPDFWCKRTASILRQIYKKEIVGVSRLRTRYGSKKNRGVKPEKFKKSSGKIIRVILQQCDKAGLTEIAKEIKGVRGKKPGRKLTDKGKTFLEGIKSGGKDSE